MQCTVQGIIVIINMEQEQLSESRSVLTCGVEEPRIKLLTSGPPALSPEPQLPWISSPNCQQNKHTNEVIHKMLTFHHQTHHALLQKMQAASGGAAKKL